MTRFHDLTEGANFRLSVPGPVYVKVSPNEFMGPDDTSRQWAPRAMPVLPAYGGRNLEMLEEADRPFAQADLAGYRARIAVLQASAGAGNRDERLGAELVETSQAIFMLETLLGVRAEVITS